MDGEVEHTEPEATVNGEARDEEVTVESSTAASQEEHIPDPACGLMDDSNETPDPEEDDGNRPVVELFVKAAVDKMKSGSCPMCHRYFLVFYILRECGLIDLVVTTFLPENPPREALEFSNGKHYPLVKIHKGIDSSGRDLTNMECDTVDEIEGLIDRFDCQQMLCRRESAAEDLAEGVFDSLYMRLNKFLKDPKDSTNTLVKNLEKLDDYFMETNKTFMLGDKLTRADCYLLPTLQHIRVAGKAFKLFEIPTELKYLWRYLKNAYETDAFKESCPADREIISHYQQKASCAPKIPGKRAELMTEDRTFSIPDALIMDNGDVALE